MDHRKRHPNIVLTPWPSPIAHPCVNLSKQNKQNLHNLFWLQKWCFPCVSQVKLPGTVLLSECAHSRWLREGGCPAGPQGDAGGCRGGCRAGRSGADVEWLPRQQGGTSGGGQGARGSGGTVTTATDRVPSSPGLEMQLPSRKITCLVLVGLGTPYQEHFWYHLLTINYFINYFLSN